MPCWLERRFYQPRKRSSATHSYLNWNLRMPKITFVEFSGTQHDVEAELGSTVMNAAFNALVPGIDADCGGQCSCATCHVIVTSEWMPIVGPASEKETSMLDMNPERDPNSRLSCQIEISAKLEGLVVNLPQFQM